MGKNPPSLSAPLIKKLLPRRPADAHKGDNGHTLILAGSRGMSGAAVLSARGALRVGAGLVTVAIVASERSVVTEQLPEALTLPLPESSAGVLKTSALARLRDYLQKRRVNALAAGPGLSMHPSIARLIKALLKSWEKPLLLDADGLNTLSLADIKGRAPLILTPHEGEMARLLKIDVGAVRRQRVELAEKLAREYHLICVLKGQHTVITNGKRTFLNPTGNPAMATGGMGDILTGAIAGFLAQGLQPWDAACAGVFLHGLAGDLARTSDRGLLASDVADALPHALAKIGVK